VRGLVKAVKAATSGPLNVNFITFLANRAQIAACIDEAVAVVSFHWGHPPREFVTALHGAGVKVWEQVGSVAAAKEAVDSGIDLIIAQGRLGSVLAFVAGGGVIYVMIYLLALSGLSGAVNLIADGIFWCALSSRCGRSGTVSVSERRSNPPPAPDQREKGRWRVMRDVRRPVRAVGDGAAECACHSIPGRRPDVAEGLPVTSR
jgi:Nitronate monooxygenase